MAVNAEHPTVPVCPLRGVLLTVVVQVNVAMKALAGVSLRKKGGSARPVRVRAIVKVDYASMWRSKVKIIPSVQRYAAPSLIAPWVSVADTPMGFGCAYPVASTRLDIVSMQPPVNPVDPAREHVRADSVIWGRTNALGCAVQLTIAVGLIASSGKWANQPRQFATVRFH